MRIARALIVAVVLMVLAPLIVPSAFAWLWPILGFRPSCQVFIPKDQKPQPGTPQWQFFPGSGRAVTALPGTAYCPVYGCLDFGLIPPFGFRPSVLPAANATNKTTGEKETAANDTATKDRLKFPII